MQERRVLLPSQSEREIERECHPVKNPQGSRRVLEEEEEVVAVVVKEGGRGGEGMRCCLAVRMYRPLLLGYRPLLLAPLLLIDDCAQEERERERERERESRVAQSTTLKNFLARPVWEDCAFLLVCLLGVTTDGSFPASVKLCGCV